MILKERFERLKKELLESDSKNKELFKEFFEWEETKLKRTNNLPELDNSSYKTLILYTHYFKRVDEWFNGKSWKDLTKEDIQKIYDDLEEGRI